MNETQRSVVLLIDELGPGGAPRQICMLALELAKRGYRVQIVCYYHSSWHKKLLSDAIPVKVVTWRNKISKIWNVYRFLREQKSEVVISYLKGPNILNILNRFPRKVSKIIISERNTDSYPISFRNKIIFSLYRFADIIVVNSKSQMSLLQKNASYLMHKIRLVQNCVDLEKFDLRISAHNTNKKKIVFGVFASYSERKRPQDLIIAAEKILNKLNGITPYFIWCGEQRDPSSGKLYKEFEKAKNKLSEYNLGNFFDLRGPTTEPEKIMREIDCVCLVSEREGFPNSICEAFASGKPVVATRVGDVPYLVTEGKTGFIAEPKSPGSIASALLKMLLLDDSKRLEMGKAARHFAEQNLSAERFCKQYIEIINS